MSRRPIVPGSPFLTSRLTHSYKNGPLPLQPRPRASIRNQAGKQAGRPRQARSQGSAATRLCLQSSATSRRCQHKCSCTHLPPPAQNLSHTPHTHIAQACNLAGQAGRTPSKVPWSLPPLPLEIPSSANLNNLARPPVTLASRCHPLPAREKGPHPAHRLSRLGRSLRPTLNSRHRT